MHAALQSGKTNPLHSPEIAESEAGASCAFWPSANHSLIYDLRDNQETSDRCYAELEVFSQKVLLEIERRLQIQLDGFVSFLSNSRKEPLRSRGEYATEILLLGLVLQRYSGASQRTSRSVVAVLRSLYWLRCRLDGWKVKIDFLRATIAGMWLVPHIGGAPLAEASALHELGRLLAWLEATGEFKREARRLRSWKDYLHRLPRGGAQELLKQTLDLVDWFRQEASVVLGRYTMGVQHFLDREYRQRGWREDSIFCGKSEVEYHLSMVCSCVMNQGLRAEFEARRHKVILVPACMRGECAATCRAHITGTDIRCTGCDPACTVNRITRSARQQGVQVFLVPHSTGFSRWLRRWQAAPEYGVVAVACLLNIVPGGLEMREKGIAAQCVPLDFPGCRRHWHRTGVSTGVNEPRLIQIARAPAR